MLTLTRMFHAPVGVSTFAGFLGAGVADLLWTAARSSGARLGELAALTLGLYGAAGVVAAIVTGWSAAMVTRAWPGNLRDDERLDQRLAAALVAGAAGALVLGVGAAAGHSLLVGSMASRKLAAIAAGGIALALCLPACVVAIALFPLAQKWMSALPRHRRLGRTGLLALLGFLLGGLAMVGALSQADWRVLDLGPLAAAALVAVLAMAHGLFWYGSSIGARLRTGRPVSMVRVVVVALALGALAAGARIPESSPTYEAAADGSLGLRLGLRVARRIFDRDGDGFSAAFGGGDCDEGRRDTYPGAKDVPGDGIDQNCEGGDAARVADAAPPVAPAVPEKPAAGRFTGNILVITVDALRADRLGVAGYGRPAGRSLTPTLDALARRGAYFRRVWAQAPNTPRSFPSLLTSRYPSEIAWQQRSLNYSPILPTNETFFEPLARGGWKPIGIFSHFYFTADRGLNQGFAEWRNEGAGTIAESNKDVPSPRIVPQVIERLERAAAAGERFALWTHLFEPHSSYMPHAEFPTRHKGLAGLEEKYDYEIAFVDGWIGKVMAALERTGLASKTAVVIAADHGEAWGEHKRYFHGQDLTEEQLRVPLIIAVPGRPPLEIDDEVALIDVGPTLLDLVGLPVPPSVHGRSLLSRLEGGTLAPRPVFAELLPATAWPKHEVMMVDRGRKLTHRITDRRYDLHDLRADPRQQKNLADDPAHRATLDELKAKLLAFEEGRR